MTAHYESGWTSLKKHARGEIRSCKYCGRIAHQGRCMAWLNAHPEFDSGRGRKGKYWGIGAGEQPKVVRNRSNRWHGEARLAKDALVKAFLEEGAHGPNYLLWLRKVRMLLDE